MVPAEDQRRLQGRHHAELGSFCDISSLFPSLRCCRQNDKMEPIMEWNTECSSVTHCLPENDKNILMKFGALEYCDGFYFAS